ncbi:Armadillo [Cynara cardunculus var. scolymus]|uniref:Armadillo n=1 Tax=Cynara cardunculus var. scolymus TaxID=59895 RepID=A0A103XPK9_CYNCS|nr:Armadillo [Cynara cardunculus var. scolymus]
MEDRRRHEQPTNSVRRSLKRKLQDVLIEDRHICFSEDVSQQDLLSEIRAQVEVLELTYSSVEADRALAKRSINILSELAKNEDIVNLIVESGAVPVLVQHLQEPQLVKEAVAGLRPYEHEVEKGSAFTLGLLAIKPEHQQFIVDAGALPHLVALLKRRRDDQNVRTVNGAIRKAADAITNLAHENSSIKTCVRVEGGIPPLVELLESTDVKVQRAAAGALRTLAFKNDQNKTQIVDCNALPKLVLMLRSEDAAIHYEAVGVIGNLVHSSRDIKKEVLLAGALQPVIELLSSTCSETQREAALLLGQFATADTECKVHIAQRGAVGPLIEMLQSPDAQLREMSAFALGRLAQVIMLVFLFIYQDTHNQAGIAYGGGIVPLLKLLDSRNGTLQHNAAFALYGLADNEDNIADLIRVGGVQKLLDGEFVVQPTRECVAKTLKRLEEKIHGRVLSHLLYLMHKSEITIQRRVALALAHLASPDDQKSIFVDGNGLDLLLELLQSAKPKHQKASCVALCKLAEKASTLSPMDAGPSSPISQANGSMLTEFVCLLLLMHFGQCSMVVTGYIYTGSVEVNLRIAQDLLRAADQYLLEGLKRLCEYSIAQNIRVENVALMYDLSESFNAVTLKDACILFVLEHLDKLDVKPWYASLLQRILPEMRNYFVRTFTRPVETDLRQ